MTSEIKLSALCDYAEGRVAVADLDADSYISTENMLQNKEGVCQSSGLPTVTQTQAYQPHDVLISNIRPYFRKIWFADRSGGCSNDVLVLRAKDTCYPRFLYYVLSNNDFFDYATATGKGTKMPRGDKGAIMRYVVPNIPYDAQVEIADTLSALDARIDENKKINHHLEQMAQAIYAQAFPCSVSPAAPLGELIDVRDGTHDSPKAVEHGFPLVTSKHLLPYGVDLVTPNRISKADFDKINERSKVDRHDILISMIGTIGLISLVIEPNVNFAIKNVGLFKTSKTEDWVYFVLCFLRSPETTNHIDMRLAGSTQKYISLGELRQLPVVIPSDDELKSFNDSVRPLFEEITLRTEEIKRLAELRDTLLPRLMSGELSVADLDAAK